MPHRKSLKSVVHNLLGTYTSRYSDHNGYWIFGMIANGLSSITINLLVPPVAQPDIALAHIQTLARRKYIEQMNKAGIPIDWVVSALLRIEQGPPTNGIVNGSMSTGHMVRVSAELVTDTDIHYSSYKDIFVAPHNPRIEQQNKNGTQQSVPGYPPQSVGSPEP